MIIKGLIIMVKIIIFGTEKMAELAYFYFTHDSEYEPVAFTVDKEYCTVDSFCNCPVIPFDEIEKEYPPEEYMMFIAIGYSQLNLIRSQKYMAAKHKRYRFVSYVCSKSTLWNDTQIGENCFILENQVIQPNVKIGNNVFIWSGTHLGHDVVIEDHCYIASQVVISGNVTIKQRSFIGINAAIRDNVSIGEECIIGAGTLILHNVNDKEVYVTKMSDRYPLNSTQFERMMDISKKIS